MRTRTPRSSLPTPTAPASPMTSPIASCTRIRLWKSHNTWDDCAPSAIRTPISWVRWVTEYAVTAYSPTADSIRAMNAKKANIDPNTVYCQRCSAKFSAIVRIWKSDKSGSIARSSVRSNGPTAAAVERLRTRMPMPSGGSNR